MNFTQHCLKDCQGRLYSLYRLYIFRLYSSMIHLSLPWQCSPFCFRLLTHLLFFLFSIVVKSSQSTLVLLSHCPQCDFPKLPFLPSIPLPNHPINLTMSSLTSGYFTFCIQMLSFVVNLSQAETGQKWEVFFSE